MSVLTYKSKVIDKMLIGMVRCKVVIIYEIILGLEHIMKQFHYLLHLHFFLSGQTIVKCHCQNY